MNNLKAILKETKITLSEGVGDPFKLHYSNLIQKSPFKLVPKAKTIVTVRNDEYLGFNATVPQKKADEYLKAIPAPNSDVEGEYSTKSKKSLFKFTPVGKKVDIQVSLHIEDLIEYADKSYITKALKTDVASFLGTTGARIASAKKIGNKAVVFETKKANTTEGSSVPLNKMWSDESVSRHLTRYGITERGRTSTDPGETFGYYNSTYKSDNGKSIVKVSSGGINDFKITVNGQIELSIFILKGPKPMPKPKKSKEPKMTPNQLIALRKAEMDDEFGDIRRNAITRPVTRTSSPKKIIPKKEFQEALANMFGGNSENYKVLSVKAGDIVRFETYDADVSLSEVRRVRKVLELEDFKRTKKEDDGERVKEIYKKDDSEITFQYYIDEDDDDFAEDFIIYSSTGVKYDHIDL